MNDQSDIPLELVLPCDDLDGTLEYFKDRGFRLDAIFPADQPRVAVVSKSGARIRLDAGDGAALGLRLPAKDADDVGTEDAAGLLIERVSQDSPLELPELDAALVVLKADDADWGTGRAGMQYRDLLPGRQGGRFIASHIRIPTGGPVPDYVHYHHVRFQMIYCYRGWVRLVYEDQGPAFVMRAGDCVLQPPGIRHRVLECSDAFEVVEIGCPAEHETLVEHDMGLPTESVDPQRIFGGQRFAFHQVADATWMPWRLAGFDARDTGIAAATGGEASAIVLRRNADPMQGFTQHDAEFVFRFVLSGDVTLEVAQEGSRELAAADAFVVPAGTVYRLSDPSDDLELLEVSLPAGYRIADSCSV